MAGRRRKKHPILKFFGLLFVLCVLTVGAVAAAFYFRYGDTVKAMYEEAEAFVEASSEETFKLSQTSTVYAADGSIISRLKGSKDTTYVESSFPSSVHRNSTDEFHHLQSHNLCHWMSSYP